MGRKDCWLQSCVYGRRRRYNAALFILNDWLESSSLDNPRPPQAANCSSWHREYLLFVQGDNADDGYAPIDVGSVGTPHSSRNEAMESRGQERSGHGGTPVSYTHLRAHETRH